MSGTINELDMFDVNETNFLRWGRFIKTLATGVDHLSGAPLVLSADRMTVVGPLVNRSANPKLAQALDVVEARRNTVANKPLLPRTLFDEVLVEQNIPVAHAPARFTQVELSQTAGEVLAIRLPNREVILAREARLANGGEYGVPVYIRDWFLGTVRGDVRSNQDRIDFNSMRVAGYSIAHCEE